jgi:hypothetical protein
MRATSIAFALGATLFVAGSWGAGAQGIFTAQRDCTVDVKSLCAGVQPGEGRILACLQTHVGELSVGCSTILSKMAWTAMECEADIRQLCPTATYENIGACMQPHLGGVSDRCRAALAYIASPAADRH